MAERHERKAAFDFGICKKKVKLGRDGETSHLWCIRHKGHNNLIEETNFLLVTTVKHTVTIDNSLRAMDIFIYLLHKPLLPFI